MNTDPPAPRVSVVVLNYNGARWLERCLNSLKKQTLGDRMEVIVADNQSPDHSGQLAEQLLLDWPNARFRQNGENLGFCEGNNRAAATARGDFLFFLNNDTWLEPTCLELLLQETDKQGAAAATPRVLNYNDDSFQSLGAFGFDLFGLASTRKDLQDTRPVLMPEGCSYLIRRDLFDQLGGFDPEFFMFSDELDLSWRIWIAGHRAIAVPRAALHHRGAANVNPAGGGEVEEFRTSDLKRFYANRNGLLVMLKNAQHLLLLTVPLQLFLLGLETIVALALTRRWGFIRTAYLNAVTDCWRLRRHIRRERGRIRQLRKRGDFWMLRFLRLRLNRWDELCRWKRLGPPKVSGS